MIKIEDYQVAVIPNVGTDGIIRNIIGNETLLEATNCVTTSDLSMDSFQIADDLTISKKTSSITRLISNNTGAFGSTEFTPGQITCLDIAFTTSFFFPIYYIVFTTHNSRWLLIEKDELISYVDGRSLQDIYPIGFYIAAPAGHIYVAHLGHNKADELWVTELWSADKITVTVKTIAFVKDDWRLTPSS